ncbi:MAG: hypothetical protein HHAS10_09340 [Candidatus Altimarinota bacterium]
MKRQFYGGKSGFTIFEMMVTITILIFFFIFALRFNWNPRTDSEKSELISVGIAGRVRTEIQNISIGKMPKKDGRIAKTTIITFSTGSILTEYYSGGTLIDSGSFNNPFFEGDRKYVIKSITWSGSATPYTGTGKLVIEPSGITFSGSPGTINANTLLEIRVGYNFPTRKIIIDKRTGQIIEKKQ